MARCGLRPWLGSLLVLAAAARPCTDHDWDFAFSECTSEGQRNIYSYPKRDHGSGNAVCDASEEGSRPMPQPLLNLSCGYSCPAGKYVGINLVRKDTGPAHRTVMGPRCTDCPAGKFSLGGGFLISGVAGDWRRTWPMELQSQCMYKTSDNVWHIGKKHATNCKLRVQSPDSVKGNYTIKTQAWNEKLDLPSPFDGELELAPGDGTACGRIDPPHARLGRPKSVVLVVKDGGCSPMQKAANAAGAKAVGVLLLKALHEGELGGGTGAGVATQEQASVPLFQMAVDDGEVLMAALKRSQVRITVPEPSCQKAQREAAQAKAWVTGPGRATVNGTIPDELRDCEPWTADPRGLFVHSGDNFNHHQIISTLSLSVRFVRAGHLTFRYSVDAEKGSDGFMFELDWNEIIPKTSVQRDYKEVKLTNMSAGIHNIKWVYTKDWAGSAGEDKAWIELVEVVGTKHADMECIPCHSARTHSSVGASLCNACRRNEYLEGGHGQKDLDACAKCPPGKWSPPGSAGLESCLTMEPCTKEDLVTTYTPCTANQRYKESQWREPKICSEAAEGAVQLPPEQASTAIACEPCQPNMHRPDGGNCVPKSETCPQGLHPVRELVIGHWRSWPSNVTHEIKAIGEADAEARLTGHGWKLEEDSGEYAYAGDELVPSRSFAMKNGTTELGDVLLKLDVTLAQEGSVSFLCEVAPRTAWTREAKFLVDNVQPEGMATEIQADGKMRVSANLTDGYHRLSWVWQFREVIGGGTGGGRASSRSRELQSGMRLFTVTVAHAANAGSSRCERCPAGSEPELEHCAKCAPGTFSAGGAGGGKCQPCPRDTFAARAGASQCTRCSRGLWAQPGSAACKFQPDLAAPDPLAVEGVAREALQELVRFDVAAAVKSWQTATEGATGPFDISGSTFMVGLFNSMPAPGAKEESESMFLWELLDSESPEGECRAGSPGSATGPPSVGLGGSILAVEAEAGVSRGLRISYGDSRVQCPGLAAKRQFNVFLQCDAETLVPARARVDPRGVFHLPNLRLVQGPPPTDSSQCANITLLWLTAGACPVCRFVDFSPQPGECGTDGTRSVSFMRTRPCIGGNVPPGYREECGGKKPLRLTLVIIVSVFFIFGCSLCGYAAWLHKKYQKYVEI